MPETHLLTLPSGLSCSFLLPRGFAVISLMLMAILNAKYLFQNHWVTTKTHQFWSFVSWLVTNAIETYFHYFVLVDFLTGSMLLSPRIHNRVSQLVDVLVQSTHMKQDILLTHLQRWHVTCEVRWVRLPTLTGRWRAESGHPRPTDPAHSGQGGTVETAQWWR